MKGNALIAISLLVLALIIGGVSFIFLQNHIVLAKQTARDAAVDGCMQNSRFTWQEKNQQDSAMTNTTSEPSRFWYKICMQEKGYEVRAEI